MLTSLRLTDKDVSILFVDNDGIREYNKEYFGKDRPTNVISFSYMDSEPDPPPLQEGGSGETAGPDREIIGDMVISLERAHEEALTLGCPFHERVFALIIHGLLHIVGYDHERDRNEARRMRYRERKLLALVKDHRLYREIDRS